MMLIEQIQDTETLFKRFGDMDFIGICHDPLSIKVP
jgi:hypothetical protein